MRENLIKIIVSYPLDLIRRRLQIQGFSTEINANSVEYNGMIDAFRKIWKYEGIFGFYRGILPNVLKVAPAMGVSFFVYEKMKQKLNIQQK